MPRTVYFGWICRFIFLQVSVKYSHVLSVSKPDKNSKWFLESSYFPLFLFISRPFHLHRTASKSDRMLRARKAKPSVPTWLAAVDRIWTLFVLNEKGFSLKSMRVHPTNRWCFRIRYVTNRAGHRSKRPGQIKPAAHANSIPRAISLKTGRRNSNALRNHELVGLYRRLQNNSSLWGLLGTIICLEYLRVLVLCV